MTKQKVLFLGDSITQNGDWATWFPDIDSLNFGIGGDTSEDVLGRLDTVVEAHPDEIVLLVGTNDLGLRRSVEQLVRNIQSILVDLRRDLPGSRMLVQSVLPRGREFADRIREANIHLRQFSPTVHAQYLDLWPTMALADGELNPAYSDDRLHLNDAGYEAWLSELRPALERLRDQPPMSRPIQAIKFDEYARPGS
jgi:lysophospholipase L1-like esterase